MAERKMTLISLQVLHALGEHPNVTAKELAEKMGRELDAIRRPARRLIAAGYISRGLRRKDGSRLKLSGKPFPSVESHVPPENPVIVRHRNIEEGFIALIPAMRSLVANARLCA